MKRAEYLHWMEQGGIWWTHEWGGFRNYLGFALILREWSKAPYASTSSTTGRAVIMPVWSFTWRYVLGRFRRWRRNRRLPRAEVR